MKRQNEVLVGILTIAAVAILIAGTYWLSRGSFRGGYDLYMVVDWGQGLKTGQRVLFAGVSIGYVEHVELKREGKLVIKMTIQREYQVPRGSTAAIQSVGLFGDMMVAITPPKGPPGPTDQYYAANDTLPVGKGAPTANDVIASADSVTRAVQALLTGIHSELLGAGAIAEVRSTLVSTNRLVAQISAIAAAQSAELTSTMASVRRTMSSIDSARIDSALRNFQQASSNVEALTSGLNTTTAKLSSIVARLDSGQGSAGKMLNDNAALYDDLRKNMASLNAILDDFKTNPKKYLGFSFSIFGGRKQN